MRNIPTHICLKSWLICFQNITRCINLETTTAVSWSHWVFWVSQQTPSSEAGPQPVSNVSLLPPPLSPILPEPSGHFLSSLHILVNASLFACYARCGIGSQSSTSSWYFSFVLSCGSSIISTQRNVIPRWGRLLCGLRAQDDVRLNLD